MQHDKRDALRALLGAGASVALRSLATGLPPTFFLHPARALAEASRAEATARVPQFLVLSTSIYGDPINANAPGCYADAGIAHPADAAMVATPLSLGTTRTTAAAPWASLPQAVLDRSMFLHHATGTVVHPDEARVLQLMGSVANNDNLPSMLAQALQQPLGCIQNAPVALGAANASEYIPSAGRPQAPLQPQALAAVLGDPNGPLSGLQALRDADLSALVAWRRRRGNRSQNAFLDRYVRSQAETRDLSEVLLDKLSAIQDNAIDSQFAAAMVLAQMKFSPVFTVHLSFGGDNHLDPGLATESAAHVAALAALRNFFAGLQAANLQDQVTFATLNVFGRTLGAKGTAGRDHLAQHHVTYAAGKYVRAGVYGG
ncbi:MAG: DUF1501 domain-containing protein, partial [Caulobacteraceae bacterium]|nr:DUF1501 domain-containing protein [Caulobacter sp.]